MSRSRYRPVVISMMVALALTLAEVIFTSLFPTILIELLSLAIYVIFMMILYSIAALDLGKNVKSSYVTPFYVVGVPVYAFVAAFFLVAFMKPGQWLADETYQVALGSGSESVWKAQDAKSNQLTMSPPFGLVPGLFDPALLVYTPYIEIARSDERFLSLRSAIGLTDCDINPHKIGRKVFLVHYSC